MDYRKIRESLGMNQTQFWSRIGVKQPAGSRYETELREVQTPVTTLIKLAYGTPAQAKRLFAELRGK